MMARPDVGPCFDPRAVDAAQPRGLSMSVNPIALSDEQLGILQRAAEPLHPQDRRVFLQTVAELLNGHDEGVGQL